MSKEDDEKLFNFISFGVFATDEEMGEGCVGAAIAIGIAAIVFAIYYFLF